MIQNLCAQKFAKIFLVLTIFTTSFLPTAASATTCICVCGTGAVSDPWIIDSDAALACFNAGSTYIAPGATAYMKQTANVSYNSNLRIYQEIKKLNYDGGGYSITINAVTNFPGLFLATAGNPITDYEIYNLKIKVSGGTTLANNVGWIVSHAENSTFDRIIIEGDISNGGGGIVGDADNVTITNSYSTGVIGVNAGGLIGANSTNSYISKSYSTGAINFGGGGLVGNSSNGVNVVNSFTTGDISDTAGGIFGDSSTSYSGSNLYTSGNRTPNGGGIASGYFVDNSPGINNSYAESHNFSSGFNKVNAQARLTGVGAFGGGRVWGECNLVDPVIYYLQAFYSTDPCNPGGGGGGGSGTDTNPYEAIGRYSITCPDANPGKNEEIDYTNNVIPVTKDNQNLVGKTISQNTLTELGNKGIIFDHWSNKVKTATIELSNFGCNDKLLNISRNKPIQFIAGGFKLQSEARGYLRTPDGKWFDLTGVTLYKDTAAFLHTLRFTKSGTYLIVIAQAPNTDSGFVPTYGYNNARFMVVINNKKFNDLTNAKSTSTTVAENIKAYRAKKFFQPLLVTY